MHEQKHIVMKQTIEKHEIIAFLQFTKYIILTRHLRQLHVKLVHIKNVSCTKNMMLKLHIHLLNVYLILSKRKSIANCDI